MAALHSEKLGKVLIDVCGPKVKLYPEDVQIKFVGLEKEHPIAVIEGDVYSGTWEDVIGSVVCWKAGIESPETPTQCKKRLVFRPAVPRPAKSVQKRKPS